MFMLNHCDDKPVFTINYPWTRPYNKWVQHSLGVLNVICCVVTCGTRHTKPHLANFVSKMFSVNIMKLKHLIILIIFTLFVHLYVCLSYSISVIFKLGMNREIIIVLLYDMLVLSPGSNILLRWLSTRSWETIALI